ncbi:titin homolog isoform X2 [Microplitis demolitor]|uniref:titin homolog isoform X2 n=1 Tax=Microplitis demolitor TaxID=69319 RepID=UPI0004CDB711|nr:titin homolog isoform X2 [Microplitis demolitor]
MEGILPSEIARLVLGYLEENECVEAAASFLTTSPHLQECRDVLQRGKKFSTKVNNFTLTYIMEKYWSVMGFVKDKLSRVDDCDMLKQCLHTDDLEEQIKLLIDGSSRGQRFFVNINVPQAQGGSPILSSSMRKRKHSGTHDREKCKRQFKLNSNEPALNTDATQLDQLPGHSEALRERMIKNLNDQSVFKSSKSVSGSATTGIVKKKLVDGEEKKLVKNSTATDTKELTHFSTAEVQTLDIESDGELEADMPIENLSLLTKEMLNRTEIQEKIAENINKALQPVDLSSLIKETSPADNPEGNTSIMTELNNAIKTIVSKTETDPMFEQFLDEIIGTNVDDLSPNDSPSNLNSADRFNEGQNSVPDDTEGVKQRLSVSSELNGATEHDTLDDLNAAAIQSIINANKITQQNNSSDSIDSKPIEKPEPSVSADVSKPSTKTDGASTGITQLLSPPRSVTSALSIGIPDSSSAPDSQPQAEAPGSILAPVSEVNENPAEVRQSATKVRRTRRQKPKPTIIQEENVVTLPTLVVCSQNEMSNYISGSQKNPSASKYPTIAPRPSSETLFLRTVQVPAINPVVKPVVKPVSSAFQAAVQAELSKKKLLLPKLPVKKETPEAVTACGNNCLGEVSDMPALNLDDSSLSGTGLSPFLKLNKRKRSPEPASPAKPPAIAAVASVPETVTSSDPVPTIDLTVDANVSTEASTHEIIKRTPKSLMKSRAKNYRLSLSTPRRRSSHVRALDFNTPTLNSSRRYSVASARPSPRPMNKSICRTSLFNSPVTKNFAVSPKKKMATKTPSKSLNSMEVPIATRSPAPTLKGNWNKVSGVDTIIGYDSQSDSCVSPPKKIQVIEAPEAARKLEKSWDSDLRQAIIIPEEDKPVKSRRNSNKSTKNDKDLAVKEPADTVSSSVDKSAGDSNQVTVEIKSSVKVTQSTVVTAKGVTKKYAKLKTIATKTSRSTDSLNTSLDTRSDKENHQSVNIGNLETPRKFDDFGIPPTPRVLSPSSNPTSFIQAHADETKVGGFITTPEFPVTPCINITPKHSDNTVDSLKKDFAPYYQPGEYEKPGGKIQDDSKSNPTGASASTSASASASTSASTESELDAMGGKLEITQFEVIKENLPKDESKELRISNVDLVLSRSKDSEKSLDNSRSDDSDSDSDTSSSSSSSSSSYYSDDQSKSRSRLSVSRRSGNISKKTDNLGLDLSDSIVKIDDKDEEQDGGKNLDDGGQIPADGRQIPVGLEQIPVNGGQIQKDIGGKIQKENEEIKEDDRQSEDKKCDDKNKGEDVNKKIDDVSKEVIEDKKISEDKDDLEEEENYDLEDGEIFEASPKKVFPLMKSDEALAAAEIETPAKNDDLLDEADISETPSGSKSGTETMTTNLTSKISKLINTSCPWNQDDGKKTLLTDPREDVGSSYLVTAIEDRQEILRRELDEKRLRMIDKLKPKKNNITAKPLYAGSKGKDKKEDKPKSRGKIEVKDKGQNNYEVKDKKDDKVRSQGSHYEFKDKKDEKVRVQWNNYEKKDEKVRSQGSSFEVKDKKDDRAKGQGTHYEVKDKKDDKVRGQGGNYEKKDEKGRGQGNSYEAKDRKDDKVRSQGSHYEVKDKKDKKDDKVRGQGGNYEKKDEKGRGQGNSYEVKDRKDDKAKGQASSYEKKDERVRSQGSSSEVKDKKDDKVRSQRTTEVKDKKDEKVKSHGSNSEVKDRKDEKKDQGAKDKKEDKEKISVVSAVRKSARYAARTAKSESSDDKNKRDTSKDKKKSRVEDKKDSKEKEKEVVKVDNKDKPGFKDSKELESILMNRLLLENSRKTKDGARDDPGVISEEVKKKTSRDNNDKVEMVKRDLFSGDEMSDVSEEKKISASQVEELLRQLHTSDPEISEPGTSGEMEIDVNVDDNVPDQKLSVLESLKLVPAAKNSGNEEVEADVTFIHCEINFVHDDNVNSKKRYRKLTIDDISMTIPTDDGELSITLSAIPYEELFSLQPPKAKKITKKSEPPKLEPVKYKRKVQLKDSRSVVTSINSLPLATSSPNVIEQTGVTKLVKDVDKNDGHYKEGNYCYRKSKPEKKSRG